MTTPEWLDDERREALRDQDQADAIAIKGVLESNGGQRMMQRLREECDWTGLGARVEAPPLCPLQMAKNQGKRELVGFLMAMAAGGDDAEE